MKRYIIASSRDWFLNEEKSPAFLEHNFTYINNKEDLNKENLDRISPRYIFFPHWNWKVSSDIFDTYECVAFHTAPLPYGRGGSPIQNLIMQDFKESPVNALKMSENIDSGPIYESMDISLLGSMSDIFPRIAKKVELMIINIINNEPMPIDQIGEPTFFKRRKPSDSEIPEDYSIDQLYNHIRMLDAPDYPKAFIDLGSKGIEFSQVEKIGDELHAVVTIKSK